MLFLSIAAYGQSGRRVDFEAAGEEDTTVVKVKTSEVLLGVTVKNQYGRPATGLSQQDFIVIEDGQRQQITSFNVREVPINVVLLLDASSSMFGKMRQVRMAAIKFIEQMRAQDKVAIVQFAEKVELIQDWTSNRADLRHAVNWRYRPGETTNLWDALYLASEELLSNVEGRKAIVVLTDCLDTTSKVTQQQAYWAAIRAGASIYVISEASALASDVRRNYGGTAGTLAGTRMSAEAIAAQLLAAERSLEEMANRTGGGLFAPVDPTQLEQAYLQIAEELKTQYLITYIPSSDRIDGKFRTIKVLLTRPGLTAIHKEGYFAVGRGSG